MKKFIKVLIVAAIATAGQAAKADMSQEEVNEKLKNLRIEKSLLADLENVKDARSLELATERIESVIGVTVGVGSYIGGQGLVEHYCKTTKCKVFGYVFAAVGAFNTLYRSGQGIGTFDDPKMISIKERIEYRKSEIALIEKGLGIINDEQE